MSLRTSLGHVPLYTGPVWGPMVPDTCSAYWHGLLSMGITSVVTNDGRTDVLERINTLEGTYG